MCVRSHSTVRLCAGGMHSQMRPLIWISLQCVLIDRVREGALLAIACVCMCVCVHVCVCVCLYVPVYMYVCENMYVCICSSIYVCENMGVFVAWFALAWKLDGSRRCRVCSGVCVLVRVLAWVEMIDAFKFVVCCNLFFGVCVNHVRWESS